MENFTNLSDRIRQFIDYKDISINKFSTSVGASNSYFNKILKDNNSIGSDRIEKILRTYPEINPEWLLTGEGDMLRNTTPIKDSKNLIPLYDDVSTIGGTSMVADISGVSTPSEYIDAGDWFSGVTAAIRHYGDSMVEYPNGCILALRQLHEQSSIVWGRNYVVETSEIRVTKRLQTCKDDENCIMAYSTSPETYPDGQLIHEPFKIRKDDIRKVFLVLGRVVKEYSSAPVFNLQR